LNSPNFQTTLQLNSTNVLLQPGDFNGSLQAYIEPKAPEQTPPDLSGLVSKPGDYNGDLESYIQLKAPKPDLSGYADRDEVYATINSELGNYTTTAAMFSELGDLYGQIINTSALVNYTNTVDLNSQLDDYADRDEVSVTINSELGNYTNTADLNSQLGTYATTVDISGLVSKPADYNGDLQSYIELKAPEPDLSGLVSKPADYNGDLQSYIELKAPEQTPPDLSGLVSKPGDYNGDLESYILLKAPEQTPPDLSGLVSKPGDYNGDLESYILLKAPDQTPPDLSGYADRDEVAGTINSELGSYTNTADLNERLSALEQRLSALESGGGNNTIESVMTSERILTQVNDTYTIEAVGDNIGSKGWYYKINDAVFNFTTDAVLTRSFTADSVLTVIVQGTSGAEYTSTLNLIYPKPTINSVNVSSGYNNIYVTMDITDVQYGWKSTIVNQTTSEVIEVTGYQYGLTETFTNMDNGDWVYHITGDQEFVSQIFTLNYVAPIPPVQLIQPTGGSFFNVHDYKYFQTTPSGRFLYGLINKNENERYLDGNLNDVEYDTIEKAWYGDVGSQFPKRWNEADGEALYDVWPITANLPIQFWYNAAESLKFQFDDPYYEETDSIITDIPILTQFDNKYTIQVVGNVLLETEGWYYSVDGASFNFTTDTIQTRSFTTNQTVTVTVQGT